jgi:hypothetical protein
MIFKFGSILNMCVMDFGKSALNPSYGYYDYDRKYISI